MSKIEMELTGVASIKPKAKEPVQKFLARLLKSLESLIVTPADASDKDKADADKIWESLSEDAQDWYNKAVKADEKEIDLPDFPDADEGEEDAPKNGKAKAKAEPAPKKGAATSLDNARKAKAKAASPKKAVAKGKAKDAKAPAGDGYKGHREGSRKGKVHELFDTKGPDVARKQGEKMELSPATLTSWFSDFKRNAA